jgi:hypothetical protein
MDAVVWSVIGLLAATLLGNFYWLGSRIDGINGRIDGLSSLDGLSSRIDGLASRLDSHIHGSHL